MKNTENRHRPISKKVRFTEEENQYINQKVKKSPFNSFQNFALHLLIAGEIKVTDYNELKRLNWEVNRIGNNVNQMAKLANQFQEISSEDIQDLQKTIHELEELIKIKFREEIRKERIL